MDIAPGKISTSKICLDCMAYGNKVVGLVHDIPSCGPDPDVALLCPECGRVWGPSIPTIHYATKEHMLRAIKRDLDAKRIRTKGGKVRKLGVYMEGLWRRIISGRDDNEKHIPVPNKPKR